MLINVVDIEATCWDYYVPTPSETIQIGISTLDTVSGKITAPFSVMIKPMHSTELSGFCKNLTGLTDEEVFETGVSFPEAIEIIQAKYNLKSRPWSSWGDYDRKKLGEDAKRHGLSKITDTQHLNIKVLYSVLYNRKSIGMAEALTERGIELEGRHHNGADDAYNTAKLLREMVCENKIKQRALKPRY